MDIQGEENDDEKSPSESKKVGHDCTVCGEDGHQCLEQLPEGAFYEAYGAIAVDPSPIPDLKNYNFCGGQPLGLPDHKWPICPKHGPMLFLFQMTDQKPINSEQMAVNKTEEPKFDPCIIQVFICGIWYQPTYDERMELSVDVGCYRGEYLYNHDCRASFDVGSYKNFAYFTRRFYPRDGMVFLTRPLDLKWVRVADEKGSKGNVKLLTRETALKECDQKFLKIYDKEMAERSVNIPRKDLVWQKFMMPHTLEGLNEVYPDWEKDPHNYTYFGKRSLEEGSLGGGKGDIDLVMHSDVICGLLNDAGSYFDHFTLIHHTQGWYEQQQPPTDYGYIFLAQEAGYFRICAHANPAGGIGITPDLMMHFVL